jgi:hypothetical protein
LRKKEGQKCENVGLFRPTAGKITREPRAEKSAVVRAVSNDPARIWNHHAAANLLIAAINRAEPGID